MDCNTWTLGESIMRNTKPLILLAILAQLFMFTNHVSADGYTILDVYVGADPTSNSWDGKDIIGDAIYFGVSKMDVVLGSSNLTVDIYTTYLNNIGLYQTKLGDLFISTDGWNPYGTQPYAYDYASNGEVWEYVLVMDNHTPTATTGTLYLYKVESPGTITLSYAPTNYIYRAGQEVLFIPNGLSPVATGTWTIYGLGTANTELDDYLQYSIDYTFNFTSALGFHWTMTCANDVIEGKVVPEPATLLLLGSGLLGLGVFRRRLKA